MKALFKRRRFTRIPQQPQTSRLSRITVIPATLTIGRTRRTGKFKEIFTEMLTDGRTDKYGRTFCGTDSSTKVFPATRAIVFPLHPFILTTMVEVKWKSWMRLTLYE
jgi:hypothetical protein